MAEVKHLTMAELEAGLDEIRCSPKDGGAVEMIARRPKKDEREVLVEAKLDPAEGVVGDSWKARGSSSTPDRSANPHTQVTLMNSRAAALIAMEKDRWPLAGDQIYIDFDLSDENLPPGSQLALGSAVVQVSVEPHTGCKKFLARYGEAALAFVNSPMGKKLHLRGINAKIIRAGTVKVGDLARKIR